MTQINLIRKWENNIIANNWINSRKNELLKGLLIVIYKFDYRTLLILLPREQSTSKLKSTN